MYGKFVFRPLSQRDERFRMENTDEQLVRNALLSRSREPLKIHNFFLAMGLWTNFYTLVIVLNGAISTMGYIQLMNAPFIVQERDQYRYEDINGVVHDILENTTTFSWMKGDFSGMKIAFVLVLMEAGSVFGYLMLLCAYRMDARHQILIATLGAGICLILFVKEYLPITKASIFFACGFAEICQMSSLMHCMESLPRSIKPFAFCAINFMNVIGYLFVLVLQRVSSDWKDVVLIYGIMYMIIGITYFLLLFLMDYMVDGKYGCRGIRLAPPSIHRSLIGCKQEALVNILKYWSENKTYCLNVEWLIDDVVFKKISMVSTSHWEKIFFILSRKTFTKKLVILLVFDLYGNFVMTMTAWKFAKQNTILAQFEIGLLCAVANIAAAMAICSLTHLFGRRFCMVLSVWLIVVAHFLGLMIDFAILDVCVRKEVPSGLNLVVGRIVGFILYSSSAMMWLMARFMIIEHIPTTVRSFILPSGYLCSSLISSILRQLHNLYKDYFTYLIPNGYLLPTLVVGILFSPLAVLLDNSSLMPVTPADVPCYYRPHTRFREEMDVKYDDQKEEN